MAVDVHVYVSKPSRDIKADFNRICGCISAPSALWTLLAIPQLPARAKPNWYAFVISSMNIWLILSRIFTKQEIELARARMPTEIKPFVGIYRWRDIKRWHTTWDSFLCKYFSAEWSYLRPTLS